MPLHIRKLCVGVDTADELRHWQSLRLGRGERLVHRTRHTPKRSDEVIDGGSLYWIIRGYYGLRQRIIGFESESADEVIVNDPSKPAKPHCLLVLDSELVSVLPRRHSAFQGWRYLREEDVPPDISSISMDDKESLSPEMLQALHDIGIVL